MGEVIGAFIGGLFLMVSIWINIRQQKRLKRIDEYEERLDIARDVFINLSNFEAFNRLKHTVDEIFQKTKADRFLLLVAVNKKTDFNDVSVVFEQHEDVYGTLNAVARYSHISIDSKYRGMLKRAEADGSALVAVDQMEPCLLKNIYQLAEVKHSLVTFLSRVYIDKDNDAVVYCSTATHHEDPYTDLELTEIRLHLDSNIIPLISDLFT